MVSTPDLESGNPGSNPGGSALFHIVRSSPMAQSVARQAVNLQVAGSNPAGGDFATTQNAPGGVRTRDPGLIGPMP